MAKTRGRGSLPWPGRPRAPAPRGLAVRAPGRRLHTPRLLLHRRPPAGAAPPTRCRGGPQTTCRRARPRSSSRWPRGRRRACIDAGAHDMVSEGRSRRCVSEVCLGGRVAHRGAAGSGRPASRSVSHRRCASIAETRPLFLWDSLASEDCSERARCLASSTRRAAASRTWGLRLVSAAICRCACAAALPPPPPERATSTRVRAAAVARASSAARGREDSGWSLASPAAAETLALVDASAAAASASSRCASTDARPAASRAARARARAASRSPGAAEVAPSSSFTAVDSARPAAAREAAAATRASLVRWSTPSRTELRLIPPAAASAHTSYSSTRISSLVASASSPTAASAARLAAARSSSRTSHICSSAAAAAASARSLLSSRRAAAALARASSIPSRATFALASMPSQARGPAATAADSESPCGVVVQEATTPLERLSRSETRPPTLARLLAAAAACSASSSSSRTASASSRSAVSLATLAAASSSSRTSQT